MTPHLARPKRSWFRCRYCGAKGSAGVCSACSDLPALEPDIVATLLERLQLLALTRRR